jgi:hypothetical protein
MVSYGHQAVYTSAFAGDRLAAGLPREIILTLLA